MTKKIKLKCPICMGDSYFYFRVKDYFNKNNNIYKCNNCGHGFYDRAYSNNQISRIYDEDYALDYTDEINSKDRRLRLEQYRHDINELTPFITKKEISVFDYGCSSGDFLDLMPSNWKKFGFEINSYHRNYVMLNKKSIKILDDIKSIRKKFDLIVMRGVIEHIPYTEDVLRSVLSKLKRNGVFFITATPDFSSVAATIQKEKWSQIICPEHIHNFTPASLSILLSKYGLVLKHLSHQYFNTPYANWKIDKNFFLESITKKSFEASFAFPGSMMTLVFEKVI
jgi:2-polyprenyl-3-methyl-5-hydroxy-6-metoxy-1,4-benzoquinol methylase